ncbi:MAG: hypothetical protein ACJA1Y_001406 [Burkholderiaceae bacterium]|jgi:uncharacterized protein (DUF2147 family)
MTHHTMTVIKKNNTVKRFALMFAGLALVGAVALLPQVTAAQTTPVGVWKSIDDETGKEKSLIRVVEAGGVLVGTVDTALNPDPNASRTCDLCTDERKGQVIVGMEIIRGVTKSAGTEGLWDGGEILDPQKGKLYKVRMTPTEGGAKLEVRGYVGMPLLGRTQTWIRVE